MPDILIGTIVGATITGIVSYLIARQQISARREETKQQLDHQEKESQINRLIEARKEHLLPLRKTISEYVGNRNQVVSMMVRLDTALKNGKSARIQENGKEYYETLECGKTLTSQLEILRGQLGDQKLSYLVKTLLDKQSEIDVARMPIVKFFNSPGSANVATIEAVEQKEESLFEEQRKELMKIDRRIEELLSGHPYK